jgi:hypothetical protein
MFGTQFILGGSRVFCKTHLVSRLATTDVGSRIASPREVDHCCSKKKRAACGVEATRSVADRLRYRVDASVLGRRQCARQSNRRRLRPGSLHDAAARAPLVGVLARELIKSVHVIHVFGALKKTIIATFEFGARPRARATSHVIALLCFAESSLRIRDAGSRG